MHQSDSTLGSMFVAEEFIVYDPVLPEPTGGLDGVRDVIERVQATFPDPQVDDTAPPETSERKPIERTL